MRTLLFLLVARAWAFSFRRPFVVPSLRRTPLMSASAVTMTADTDTDMAASDIADADDTAVVRRYILLRHGQTDMNAAGIIQGSSDASRLTPLGQSQVREAARGLGALLSDDGPLAAVFCSNVSRAIQTLAELKSEWEEPTGNDPLSGQPPRRRMDISGASTYMAMLGSLREIDLYEWQEK